MSIAISNNTKLNVPMNIQRNKELNLKMKMRAPGTTAENPTYLNLTNHYFRIKIVDADGVQKFMFSNNRFGVNSEFERGLIISQDETDQFEAGVVYYYDLYVRYPDGKNDYWFGGRVNIADKITPSPTQVP